MMLEIVEKATAALQADILLFLSEKRPLNKPLRLATSSFDGIGDGLLAHALLLGEVAHLHPRVGREGLLGGIRGQLHRSSTSRAVFDALTIFQTFPDPADGRLADIEDLDDVGGGVPGADECGDLEPLGLHLGLRMSYDGNIGLNRKLMSASFFVVFLAQLL